MKIVTNKNKLRIPTKPCDSVEEGIQIGRQMIEFLKEHGGGIGLAANQVGINKSVCIISSRKDEEPKILVNPRYVESSNDRVAYIESCLSLPGKTVKTIRHKNIKITCDNWENEVGFAPDGELTKENYWEDMGLLECVCVQHEIGHLEGQLITDIDVRFPVSNIKSERIGRNQSVMVKKDEKTQFIKYKKAQKLLKDGWEII